MKKVLIHTCCGPCLIYPYKWLKEAGYKAFSYFYNPNIHPYSEYLKRFNCWKDYVEKFEIPHKSASYQPEFYFRAVSFHEEERCLLCYQLRLGAAAKMARESEFDYFTTTLLVSPYQKHEKIKEIGERIGKTYNVPFLYEDFRKGYYEGVEESRELSMYRQWYCGCLFSEIERIKEKEEKKKKKQESHSEFGNTG